MSLDFEEVYEELRNILIESQKNLEEVLNGQKDSDD